MESIELINILLGIVGIIVSIGVGVGTFYLADKRTAKISRWENVKKTVLRDLSMSLSEENIPNISVIKAMIRSSSNHHLSDDSVETLCEEIIDNLLWQITIDPFLEAERRKQLQNDLLNLKQAQKKT